jgi:tubulin polyglutamylase TTLL5
MLFRPYIDPMSIRPYKPADKGLYFKNYNGIDVKLIRYTLEDNGFREATDRKHEWTLMWACSNIKSVVYQNLTRYQKVNHWPKTTEMTRKDCMYKHFAMMRSKHGAKHFSFVPQSFVLPHEVGEL